MGSGNQKFGAVLFKTMNDPTVFLLHGLGGYPWTLSLMQMHLVHQGFRRVHALTYDTEAPTLAQSMTSASVAMDRILDCVPEERRRQRVLLVGHSWGGLVANNLHQHGWDVVGAVYIASPLHGASMLHTLREWIPEGLAELLRRPAYNALLPKGRESPPPHPYHTVSAGYFGSDFDGCVWAEEATLHPDHHTHLTWEDHRLVIAKPRLWRLVAKQLKEQLRPSHPNTFSKLHDVQSTSATVFGGYCSGDRCVHDHQPSLSQQYNK